MHLKKWADLPETLQNDAVRPYYDSLRKKTAGLIFKRLFDIAVSLVMLIILSPIFLIVSVMIVADSRGGVFFRQTRITAYGKEFRIHKFRTMVVNAEALGTQVTVGQDSRVTRVGRMIRNARIDEIPQLIDILEGNMTFVGTRPEVPAYVHHYTPEMMATLLLPAGVTSETSIYYKDEGRLLEAAKDADEVYINEVLPGKMRYNLLGISNFSIWRDIKIMFMTFFAVLGKEYKQPELEAETVPAEYKEEINL